MPSVRSADAHRSPATALLRRSAVPSMLAIASLTLWFFLAFPWNHHNESFVWAIDLQRTTFWQVFSSNPMTQVQTYRPLGVAIVWLSYHWTHSEVWLQQLINFAITTLAWILALHSVRERFAFAALSFLCGAGYFSGYIYLFQLQGVFYAPLLVFIAILLVWDQRRDWPLDWASGSALLGLTAIAALFHSFALFLCAAYVGGRWMQNRIARRPANFAVMVCTVVVAGAATKLLVASSADMGANDPVNGMLTSYRALELDPVLGLLSAVLAISAASLVPGPWRHRATWMAAAAAMCMGLAVCHWPIFFAWILVCSARAVVIGRWALFALIAACAVLPAVTGTGSPTYTLFAIMPCIVATVEGARLPASEVWSERISVVVILGTLLLLIGLKLGVRVPIASQLSARLRAEQEKTQQLALIFKWLDSQQTLQGRLMLCHPAEFPIRSGDAAERTFRAPTGEGAFEQYLTWRYGTRFMGTAPQLMVCFAGQRMAGAEILMSLPGTWAGEASVQRVDAKSAAPTT